MLNDDLPTNALNPYRKSVSISNALTDTIKDKEGLNELFYLFEGEEPKSCKIP